MSKVTLQQLMDVIEALAPLENAEAWDNSGLCLGHPAMEVTGVVLAMEADDAALDLAKQQGCNVIVAHHPLIFSPVKTLREDMPQGAFLARALRENVAVYCAHTNFDACAIGPSAALAGLCGAENIAMHGFFAVGDVQSDTHALCEKIASPYGCVYGEGAVRKAAFCGGSAGGLLEEIAPLGVDALVCGELKYHEILEYLARGMAVVTCGHRESEAPALPALMLYLQTNENLLQYNIRYFLSGSAYVLCSKGGKAI